MDKTDGLIMIDGNTAGALGAIYRRRSSWRWYPITPATSLADALIDYLPNLRIDPETKAPTYAIVQAEDELAALGMVIGAGWAGARAMTTHLRPGHLADGRVRRPGLLRRNPGGDLGRAAHGPGHRPAHARVAGRPVSLLPGPRRHAACRAAARLGARVLRVRLARLRPGRAAADAGVRAERPRPRHEPLDEPSRSTIPTEPIDRGKVLTAEQTSSEASGFGALQGRGRRRHRLAHAARHRHPLAPYFTRGTGHNEQAQLTERADDWESNMDRLDAQVRDGARARARAGDRAGRGRRDRHHRLRLDRRRRSKKRATCWPARASRPSYLRLRALPMTTTLTTSSRRTSASMWSS